MRSNTSGNTMRAGVQIAEILMQEGHHMPPGARKTITFLVGEAYSYGPNVLEDLAQAIRTKANAALKVIIANVPIEGPKYTGTILGESQDLLLEDPTSQGKQTDAEELPEKLEAALKEIEELRGRNQELEATLAVLQKKLAEAQASAEGLPKEIETDFLKNGVPTSQSLEAPGDEFGDEDKVSLASEAQALDAIKLVAQSTFLKDTNQHMRCERVCAEARKDGTRGRSFTDLKGIIAGIRDGTFDVWIQQLQAEGLTNKSAGLFLNLRNYLVGEKVFGDGLGGISMNKIREALIPLLRKRGYRVILSG